MLHYEVYKFIILIHLEQMIKVSYSTRLVLFFKRLLNLNEVKDFIREYLRFNIHLRLIQRFNGEHLLCRI